MDTTRDFTPSGLCVVGPYENDRNADHADLFKAMIREAFEVTDVICAHHLTYVKVDHRADGFDYQVVEEQPSADALLFNHGVAKKLWGENRYKDVLVALALEPVETRDTLALKLFTERGVS